MNKLGIRRRLLSVLMLAISSVCAGFGFKAAAQSVPLSIRQVDGKALVSWAGELQLVQPEFRTDLSSGTWQDLGAPTESNNLLETIASGQGFYRLRFLAPRIQTQPAGQSLAAGGSVSLGVAANGTAPLTYQWLKDGVQVPGQTASSYLLKAVSVNDSGGYSVVVGNSVGSVTSLVALVTLTNVLPSAPPEGIYLGNFSGQTNGGFAALVRTNGVGIVLAHNTTLDEGLFGTNIALAQDGRFAMVGGKQGKVSGKVGLETLDGTLTGTNEVAVTFTATKKPDTGIHQASAGFYSGTFGGFLTGSAFVVLAADGAAFTYLTSPTLGVVSTSTKIDSSNSLSATAAYVLPGTTVPAPILITGTLDPAAHMISGTYGLGGIKLGSFSINRNAPP